MNETELLRELAAVLLPHIGGCSFRELADSHIVKDVLAKARELLCPAAEAKGRREAFEETLQKCDGLDWHCNSRAFKDWLRQKRDACGAVKEPEKPVDETVNALNAEVLRLRAEVERWKAKFDDNGKAALNLAQELDRLRAENAKLAEERDALREQVAADNRTMAADERTMRELRAKLDAAMAMNRRQALDIGELGKARRSKRRAWDRKSPSVQLEPVIRKLHDPCGDCEHLQAWPLGRAGEKACAVVGYVYDRCAVPTCGEKCPKLTQPDPEPAFTEIVARAGDLPSTALASGDQAAQPACSVCGGPATTTKEVVVRNGEGLDAQSPR